MKVAETKTTASQAKSNAPFFQKGVRQGLSNSAENEKPFFQKKVNDYPAIQAKLHIGKPNDKYEVEADAVADKVVQRLSNKNTIEQHNNGKNIQAKPIASITPISSFIQTKCATCKQEEHLQKKEADEELLKSTLQKKPIFESNAEPVSDDENNVQRKCAACEQKEKLLQPKPEGNSSNASSSIETSLSSSKGAGSPMNAVVKNNMESSFGIDFSSVRIHDNSAAIQMSKDLNAQAFTHGNDIYFNEGKYNPESASGKHLLAHELTHTVQQGNNNSVVQNNIIQRTTHSGSPANCKSASLPSWAAGVAAHAQIDTIMLALGAHPNFIPRGTKALRTILPPPAGTPYGFADIWKDRAASVEMAEIKSSSAGDAAARRDINHYVLRHDQWALRAAMPPVDAPDLRYLAFIGGIKPATLLNLFPFTATGVPIGPFIADLSKLLWMEGDATGSVVYWCTPMPNPLWLVVIVAIVQALKQLLDQAKRVMQEILEGLEGIGDWIGENWAYILAAIVLILIIALCIFFAAEILAFLALVAAAVAETALAMGAMLANAFTAFETIAALLLIVGISLPGSAEAATQLQGSLQQHIPANTSASDTGYENGENENGARSYPSAGATSSGDNTAMDARRFISTLSPLTNPMNLYNVARSGPITANRINIGQIRSAVGILARLGDPSTAGYLNGKLNTIPITE